MLYLCNDPKKALATYVLYLKMTSHNWGSL